MSSTNHSFVRNRMNYFHRKSLILCLALCMFTCPAVSISAEALDDYNVYYEVGNGYTVYNLEELLLRYEVNSSTYQRNTIDYQMQALAGSIADNSYNSINNQYLNALHRITELNEAKEVLIIYRDSLIAEAQAVPIRSGLTEGSTEAGIDNTSLIADINMQISSVDLQLAQHINNTNSLEISVSEARLQKDIASFYNDYQYLITKEAQNKLRNEFIKSSYTLIIHKEQLDYAIAYQDYYNIIMEVDTIKYRLGLITQLTLDADITNVMQNNIMVSKGQNKYDSLLHLLKNETAISDDIKIRFNLANVKNQYVEKDVISRFVNNNAGYLQIQNYIRSYQNYLGSASAINNELYQQTQLRINNYSLQRKELENSIGAFVKEAIKSYEMAFQSKEAAWRDIQVKTKQYKATKKKLDYKRASKLQLQQALYEMEAAEVKYYQACYEIVVWQDILDNNIYGVTP